LEDSVKPDAGENQHLDRAAKRLLKELPPLVKRWRDAHSQDLTIRMDTGRFLNRHLGPPNKRQQRGKGVMKIVCEQLGVSMSDASRMRGLAQKFGSTAELKAKHPTVGTWTALRNLLPKLDAHGELKSSADVESVNVEEVASFERLLHSLSDLSLAVDEVETAPSDSEKKDLLSALEDFALAISERFHIQVSVSESPQDVVLDFPVQKQAA